MSGHSRFSAMRKNSSTNSMQQIFQQLTKALPFLMACELREAFLHSLGLYQFPF